MPIETTGPNAEQIKYWNETAGPKWVALQDFLDQQIRPLGLLAMERGAMAAGESVLDVGCGCGDTTLEIARRVGSSGSVTGIDISTPMLERARAAAAAAGLKQASFENADAQTATLPSARYDLLFSRFGVMFFIDPVAAFANLRSALKPGGRVSFICWRAIFDNPWMLVPFMAAAPHLTMPPPPAPDAPGPFAFADPDRLKGILAKAGFADVALEEVSQPLRIGAGTSVERTVEFLLQMGPTANAVRDASPEVRRAITQAVTEALQPFVTPDGVRMDSSTWIATARNR